MAVNCPLPPEWHFGVPIGVVSHVGPELALAPRLSESQMKQQINGISLTRRLSARILSSANLKLRCRHSICYAVDADWGARMAANAWQDRLKRLLTVSLSDLNPLRREESYVSVDIGSSSIKMLEVRTTLERLEILNWGVTPTPPSAIQSNMVTSPTGGGGGARTAREQGNPRTQGDHGGSRAGGDDQTHHAAGAKQAGDRQHDHVRGGQFHSRGAGQRQPRLPGDRHPRRSQADGSAAGGGEEGHRQQLRRDAARRRPQPIVVDVDYFALENMYEIELRRRARSGRRAGQHRCPLLVDQHPQGRAVDVHRRRAGRRPRHHRGVDARPRHLRRGGGEAEDGRYARQRRSRAAHDGARTGRRRTDRGDSSRAQFLLDGRHR